MRASKPLFVAGQTRSAFTLIELMVSIALALLLVLGINAVFKLSADAVGTGMQMGEITRQFRVAQKMFESDFQYMANASQNPGLIITSYNQPAFKDKNDELTAETAPTISGALQPPFDPTGSSPIDKMHAEMLDVRDPDGNSIYTVRAGISPNTYLPQIINNRDHRVDILAFGVKNPQQFQRQSPNYGQLQMTSLTAEYSGNLKSTDAWVVYGHVLQPNANVTAQNLLTYTPTNFDQGGPASFLGLGVTFDPYTGFIYTSAPTNTSTKIQNNPNNYYASNWILGRSAVLLSDPSVLDSFTKTTSGGAQTLNPQSYVKDPYNSGAPNYVESYLGNQPYALRPVSWGTQLNVTSPTVAAAQGNVQNQTSQADVAGMSMTNFRQLVLNAELPTLGSLYFTRWYQPLLTMGYGQDETKNPQAPPSMGSVFFNPPTWIPPTIGENTPPGRFPGHAFRYMAQAWPDKLTAGSSAMNASGVNTPGMAQQLAVQTPVFIRGCSQFIVEYAGDYVKQQYDTNLPVNGLPPGTIYDIGEDGQIDFDVVSDGNNGFMKRIRWYGMTRSLDEGQTVEDTTKPLQTTGNPAFGAPPTNPNMVRPLYRYIQQFLTNNTTQGPAQFIKYMPFEKPVDSAGSGTGTATYLGFPDQRSTAPATDPIDSYTCAWGPADMNLDLLPADFSNNPEATFAASSLNVILGASGKFPSRSLMPWLIRITIRIDDPTGRLPDGQTMQYILQVPRTHS